MNIYQQHFRIEYYQIISNSSETEWKVTYDNELQNKNMQKISAGIFP
jgi:hypothetical protein